MSKTSCIVHPANTPGYTYIYALCEPETGEIRYVGKANNLRRRMKQHLVNYDSEKTPKAAWLSKLGATGRLPLLRVLEQVPIEDWPRAECDWIATLKAQGCNLTNLKNGGDGVPESYRASPEERQRRSDRLKAFWRPIHEQAARDRIIFQQWQEANNYGLE